MTGRPRLRKKDLEEDKVYLTLAGATGFVVRYRLQIALVALAILAAFAGGYYLHAHSGRVAADAAWALYQAAFKEEPAERTAALQKVVAEYPGTHSARFASFDLANALYDEGKYEEALEAFQKFRKENPKHLLALSAAEAVGYCRESLGQWKEAIGAYEDLLRGDPEGPLAARASFRVGHCYEKLENSEKAIEAYEKVLELAPTSLWTDYSSQRLAALSPETHKPAETEPLPPGFTTPFAPVPPPPQ